MADEPKVLTITTNYDVDALADVPAEQFEAEWTRLLAAAYPDAQVTITGNTDLIWATVWVEGEAMPDQDAARRVLEIGEDAFRNCCES